MLSYSQVDRILRPLRNKCNAFATHVSKPANDVSTVPPLSVLHPPDNAGSRVYFDKHRVNTLELSRKQYAVRDCFKDVLAKILGDTQNRIKRRILRRIPLSSYWRLYHCNTESEHVPSSLGALTLGLHRKAVVAHSLELVLQLSPHQPPFLLLLLDVTLAHHLENESYALLQALLIAACNSDASLIPSICHPTSETFLVDLCKQWTLSGLTVDGFVRVLMGVLRSVDCARIWTSKAMMTFILETAKDNMTSFMTCVCELLGALPDISTTITKSSAGSNFLQRMLDIACEDLLSQDCHLETDWIIVLLDYMDNLVESADQSSTEDILLAATSALICLATHWLLRPPEGMLNQLMRVKLLLDTFRPKPTTYNALVSRITASEDLHHLKQSIRSYTSVLRSHGLLRHEASLWACALRQIEVPAIERALTARSDAPSLKELRLNLIELVEEAEKRCFGRPRPSPPPQQGHDIRGHSRRRKRSSDGSGTWTWDPMFGCWHRPHDDRPVLKKRDTRPARLSCPAPLNVRKTRRRLSLCSPTRTSLENENDDSSTEFDQGLTDFATLLCRAISNRTVLHPEKESPTSDDKNHTCSSPDYVSPLDESDDKLDLFLCE